MAPGSTQMSDPILKVDHLSMKFGGLVAVNDLSFEAKRGEIISYENVTKEVEAAKPFAADLAEERYIREHNKNPKPIRWKYDNPKRRITSNLIDSMN